MSQLQPQSETQSNTWLQAPGRPLAQWSADGFLCRGQPPLALTLTLSATWETSDDTPINCYPVADVNFTSEGKGDTQFSVDLLRGAQVALTATSVRVQPVFLPITAGPVTGPPCRIGASLSIYPVRSSAQRTVITVNGAPRVLVPRFARSFTAVPTGGMPITVDFYPDLVSPSIATQTMASSTTPHSIVGPAEYFTTASVAAAYFIFNLFER